MTRWLREPLLHFLVAGGVLFLAWGALNDDTADAGDAERPKVHVSAGDVTWLTETWSRQWRRPPTPEELRGLLREFLNEQLLAREAQELGLATDDTIVRRRLAQKLDFLVRDTVRLVEPTEPDLRRHHEEHAALFAHEPVLSFSQVYFQVGRRPDAAADARAALDLLANAGADPDTLGDVLLVESDFQSVPLSEVAARMGADFAEAVRLLAPGAWCGPIESGFGLHLVQVTEASPARRRDFDEARPDVLEHWRAAEERVANERYIATLLGKYDVVVDESVRPLLGPLDAGGTSAR